MEHDRSLNNIAETYVRLVLRVGQHDPDYVDAYYGPERLSPGAEKENLPALQTQVLAALAELKEVKTSPDDEMALLRFLYLQRQLLSVSSRIEMLMGKQMRFDEESRLLYDAVAPSYPEAHFREVIAHIDSLLPGTGRVAGRYEAFRMGFVIRKEKLDAVFGAAIDEGRKRTRRHVALPGSESFRVEYVTDKPWSGYNWYKGGSHSLIQINTDLPIFIDRAVDLACHEGYPGHHVYNSLLEEHLVSQRGWVEFSVYALFSPQSLVAEGTANYGIEVAFDRAGRVAFEQDVLFPLAGLPPADAGRYYALHELFLQLGYAGNEAARRYLDGAITREAAVEWLVEYALMSPDRALQRTKFFDKYRSYVINYNLGQDIVRRYIETRSGSAYDSRKRWEEFARLLSSPRLPSGLM